MDLKLWVDDLIEAPEGWSWAKSNTEAIRILDNPNIHVTELALDHDIMHQIPNEGAVLVGGSSCTETFEATARFIWAKQTADGLVALPLYVTIQTANPVGREILLNILKKAPGVQIAVEYTKQPHNWRP